MANSKSLLIFEEPSHAKKISEYQKANEDLVVSFSVGGKVILDKKGIKCCYPDELVEIPDLNQIGIDNIERVQTICDFLDKKLQENFPFLRDNGINLCSAGYYNIKIFFDVLYSSYFILERLFNEVNPKQITVFKKNGELGNLIKGQNSIVPLLVENVFSKHYNIKIISNGCCHFSNSFLSGLPVLRDFLIHMYKFLLNKLNKRKYSCNGIILSNTHDIPYLVNGILDNVNFYKLCSYKDFMTLYSIRSFDLRVRRINKKNKVCNNLITKIFNEVLHSKIYRNMFVGDDNLFCFANKCLKDYMSQTIGHLLPYTEYIQNWIADLDPEVLLTSGCRLDLVDAYLLELARSLKIPVVTYQEGGGAGYLDWPMFNLDMNLSDYFLVYGNGVKNSHYITGEAQVVPVGSIHLANIERHTKVKLMPQRCVIYVVLDIFKTGTWQHYPYNGGFFSQAYLHQLKILDTLKQFRTITFVLKTIKGRELLYKRFADNDPIQIVTKPLTSVLNEASAFILDFPSTVLQECLLTDKPIALLYNPDCIKFESNALKSLSERVRISSNPDEFHEVISSLIKDVKSGTRMTGEHEFLKDYCLMDNTSKNLENFFNKFLIDSPGFVEQTPNCK